MRLLLSLRGSEATVAISRYAGRIRWQKKMCSDPPWLDTIDFTRRFRRFARNDRLGGWCVDLGVGDPSTQFPPCGGGTPGTAFPTVYDLLNTPRGFSEKIHRRKAKDGLFSCGKSEKQSFSAGDRGSPLRMSFVTAQPAIDYCCHCEPQRGAAIARKAVRQHTQYQEIPSLRSE